MRHQYSVQILLINTIYVLWKNENKINLNANVCLNSVNYFLRTLDKQKHLEAEILLYFYYFLTK